MSFRNSKSRQPEIIRAVQKDSTYTRELTEDLSDILRLTGSRNWIQHNHLCKLISEIVYHGFASINSLQTLGEEYTGIVQVDSQYISIPSKVIQLIAIILEFGGDSLFMKLLNKLESDISKNSKIRQEAKEKLTLTIAWMKKSTPYLKALHKTIFYFHSGKYQISKRITGINYVLIRRWMQPDHSLYGYRILGFVTLFQLLFSLLLNSYDTINEIKRKKCTDDDIKTAENTSCVNIVNKLPQCILCLELRTNTSLTPCGHIFCWKCILDWLDERDECPLCREAVKKSDVIQLRNFI